MGVSRIGGLHHFYTSLYFVGFLTVTAGYLWVGWLAVGEAFQFSYMMQIHKQRLTDADQAAVLIRS